MASGETNGAGDTHNEVFVMRFNTVKGEFRLLLVLKSPSISLTRAWSSAAPATPSTEAGSGTAPWWWDGGGGKDGHCPVPSPLTGC